MEAGVLPVRNGRQKGRCTEVYLVNTMVFPVVMYRYESLDYKES